MKPFCVFMKILENSGRKICNRYVKKLKHINCAENTAFTLFH